MVSPVACAVKTVWVPWCWRTAQNVWRRGLEREVQNGVLSVGASGALGNGERVDLNPSFGSTAALRVTGI